MIKEIQYVVLHNCDKVFTLSLLLQYELQLSIIFTLIVIVIMHFMGAFVKTPNQIYGCGSPSLSLYILVLYSAIHHRQTYDYPCTVYDSAGVPPSEPYTLRMDWWTLIVTTIKGERWFLAVSLFNILLIPFTLDWMCNSFLPFFSVHCPYPLWFLALLCLA